MGKVVLNIVEDFFYRKDTNNYKLSILIGVDSFSYIITDQTELLALKSFEVNSQDPYAWVVERLLSSDPLLKNPFGKVKIGLANTLGVLVPNRLYVSGQESIYLQHLDDIEKNELATADDLSEYRTQYVYCINNELLRTLSNLFPNHTIYHLNSIFLKGLYPSFRKLEQAEVFINIFDNSVLINVLNQVEILYSNIFTFNSPSDFIYYLLLVYDQLQLDAERTPIHIAGHLYGDSDIYRLIYRYIRHSDFIKLPDFFVKSAKFDELPEHQYFDLCCLAQL